MIDKSSGSRPSSATDAARKAEEARRRDEAAAETRREQVRALNQSAALKSPPARALSPKDHGRLFGGNQASAAQAARTDAARVAAAAKTSPSAGARLFHDLLTTSEDPTYRKTFIDASAPTLTELGRSLTAPDSGRSVEDSRAAADSLSRAAELAGNEGAKAMAKAFAAGMPDKTLGLGTDGALGEELRNAMKEGAGAAFSVHLAEALRESNKTVASADATRAAHDAIDEAKGEFEELSKKVQEHESALSRLMQGFGPELTDPQKKKAIDAFREKYKADYEEMEKAGAKLSPMLEGASAALESPDPTPPPVPGGGRVAPPQSPAQRDAGELASLKNVADGVMEQLPMLGFTDAGKGAYGAALRAQAAGEHTFLDRVDEAAQKQPDPQAYKDAVADHMVQALGSEALKLAADGATEQAQALYQKALIANATTIGFGVDSAAAVSAALGQVMQNKPGAEQNLTNLFARVSHGTGHALLALKSLNTVQLGEDLAKVSSRVSALAVTARLIGNARDWSNFSDADLQTKLLTMTSGVEASTAASRLVMETVGVAEKFGAVSKLLGRVNGLTNVIYAAADAKEAFNQAKEGNFPMATAVGTTAAGEATLAGAAIAAGLGCEVVPGVGTVVGSALLAGGVAAQFAVSYFQEKAAREEDEAAAKEFLVAGGVNASAAAKLSSLNDTRQNVGPFIAQVAPRLGLSPEALMAHLGTVSQDKLTAMVEMARHLEQTDGTYAASSPQDGDYLAGKSVYIGGGRAGGTAVPVAPRSLTSAVAWLRKQGIIQ